MKIVTETATLKHSSTQPYCICALTGPPSNTSRSHPVPHRVATCWTGHTRISTRGTGKNTKAPRIVLLIATCTTDCHRSCSRWPFGPSRDRRAWKPVCHGEGFVTWGGSDGSHPYPSGLPIPAIFYRIASTSRRTSYIVGISTEPPRKPHSIQFQPWLHTNP